MQNGYQELKISGCRLKKAAAAYFKCEALPVFGAANPMVPEELDKKGDRESLDTFEKKWACYNVPMKAVQPNGYDVIMASGMLGFLLPILEQLPKINLFQMAGINLISYIHRKIHS